MNFINLVKEAKMILEVIDSKDEKVIQAMEAVSNLPFIPKSFSILVDLLKKYEPEVVKVLLLAIETAEHVGGLSSVKLQNAVEFLPGIPDVASVVSQTVGLFNRVLRG